MKKRFPSTYLKLWMSSEGADPSEITSILMGLGFQPTHGRHDYTYRWRQMPDMNQVLELARHVQISLRGCGVYYKIETVGMKE